LTPGGLQHRDEAGQAFGNGAIDVLARKTFRSGGKHGHLVHAGGHGGLEALQVGGQGRIDHVRTALDASKDLRASGHLRYPLGRDETSGFDEAQAGGAQVIDQPHLVRHVDGLFLVLQSVPGADLDQTDPLRQAHRLSSSSTSALPSLTSSPSAQYSALTMPAWGARMLCSIFMASITISATPASTAWPGSTRMRTMLPFM